MRERRDPLITSNVERRRALFVRLDKIGDLVLSLPVDELLEPDLISVDWLVAPLGEFVVRSREPLRKYHVLDKSSGFKGFLFLRRFLKQNKFDMCFVFHAPWWVTFCVWLARIPLRVGPLSRWHSFLFFNFGVRQKRSEAKKNEFDYNRELVVFGLDRLGLTPLATLPFLKLQRPNSGATIDGFGLKPKKFTVIHPGMAGSARNWPEKNYIQLIKEVSKLTTVVVTGTSADNKILNALKLELTETNGVCWLDSKLSGDELLDILSEAHAVVAPSTGVVHLAASLGVRTVGLYSPVRVQHPRRWGPRGKEVVVCLPEVECPGQLDCLMEKCSKFDCMNQIQPSNVLDATIK